jgi:hypothetical protein
VISPEVLALLVSGAVNESARAIEAVGGRKLTRTELEAIGIVLSSALRTAAELSASKPAMPPSAPREVARSRFFSPVQTQEIRAVTNEDIAKARQK